MNAWGHAAHGLGFPWAPLPPHQDAARTLPGPYAPQVVLFYAPQCEDLARKIAGLPGSKIRLGKIRWR
jgi:hypothetical protein